MFDERRIAETEKTFIKKFKSKVHCTPTNLLLNHLSFENVSSFFLDKFLFISTFGLIVHLQIKNIRSFKQHNTRLKLGHNIFKILIINGFIPICLYKFLHDYLRNYTYSSTYTFLMKPENSHCLIDIYRYPNLINYRRSKFFINNTNIILCRYFVKYVYD